MIDPAQIDELAEKVAAVDPELAEEVREYLEDAAEEVAELEAVIEEME